MHLIPDPYSLKVIAWSNMRITESIERWLVRAFDALKFTMAGSYEAHICSARTSIALLKWSFGFEAQLHLLSGPFQLETSSGEHDLGRLAKSIWLDIMFAVFGH